MLNKQQKQELEALQERWQALNQQINAMQKQLDLTTDAARKIELGHGVKDKRVGLQAIEQQMQALSEQADLAKLRGDLRKQIRNGRFDEAVKTAEQIFSLNPQEPHIEKNIAELGDKQRFYDAAKNLLGQLGARITELDMDFYKDLIEKLHPKNQDDDAIRLLSPATQDFIDGKLDAEQYQQTCQALVAQSANNLAARLHVDTADISQKILSGDTILFLGPDLINCYDADHPNEQTLAGQLAAAIEYQTFQGLPAIAELYNLQQGGRKTLLDNLHQSLPQDAQRFRLYQSLARAAAHFVVVTSAYDCLLETAFLQAGKPFVELSSIISRTQKHDIGHVVVNFSDDDKGEEVYPQEKLSTLNLLDDYSVIYKIRGSSVDTTCKQTTYRKNALTLSESNYLTFAENARKMIPDFLAEHLREKEILFLGFAPRSWEDRLLVHTLLSHRYNSEFLCLRAKEESEPDKLEVAFWKKQQVEATDIDFHALDEHLQGALT